MDLETILQTLEYNTGRFPREALQAAVARREEITPHLLSIIEDAADDIEFLLEEEAYIAHLYAFFLLAQFREERAYPLIVEFFSTPGDMVMDVTGDFVTEDLGRVLASVSGGDLGPMKALVEAPSVNEYVRAAALGGMVNLFVEGVTPREEIIAYFRHLFQGGWEQPTEFLWAVLVNYSLDLYAEDLMPEIRQAFADDRVAEDYIDLAWVEKAMAEGKAANLWQLRRDSHSHFIEDTIREMEGWACFERSPKPVPAVGRNDPCPCGSGRKYKHCCGRPR